ncbi:hypothetical protein THMIRHAS_19360 [Thiosulfatimonas sediminis]|uniref:Uncharacterized protein n=1 Tax=Thiosulfatimonas sediminis TaxID=2675054 RepID=A0A6F8PWP2_9GAMM|nr:hypothetical protein [Thiosulfatimonas sediminis]BBP46563.1 hypothetical protein THMIRHAS_19360 [Thiosulfatimonas sediminis]
MQKQHIVSIKKFSKKHSFFLTFFSPLCHSITDTFFKKTANLLPAVDISKEITLYTTIYPFFLGTNVPQNALPRTAQ